MSIKNKQKITSIVRAPYDKKKVLKRDIKNKKDMMREMYACKDCDCETYPWCVNMYTGGLCKKCIDLDNYCHKKALRGKPGLYGGTSRVDDRPIQYPYIKLLPTPLDGDCMYRAISMAFDSIITVDHLRYLVAMCQTPSTFASYKELSDFMSEYRPIRAAHNLRDFRVLIKKKGDDIGCENCVWGDENALTIISLYFSLGLMIFNEKGILIQRILPCIGIGNPSRYIMLLLNGSKSGQEHYNLLEFNRQKLLTENEVNELKILLSGGSQRSRSRSE